MRKTTLDLPDDLREHLRRIADAQGWSEAETIRAALRPFLPEAPPPEPKLPLFSSGDPTLAERADALVDGFGRG